MNDAEYILIEANDCSPFQLKPEQEEVLHFFARSVSTINTFHFSSDYYNDEKLPIAEYDYYSGTWWAGRLVGEATFKYKDNFYKILIKPRFGELHLFRMLEEIFNVKLTESSHTLNRRQDFQFLIKKLISFLWLNMLAKANKHGLPRNTITKTHRGQTIRGRINIQKSVKTLFTSSELISNYREKEANEVIAQILLQAYNILLKDYHLGSLNTPNNAQDAIIQFESARLQKRHISFSEYQNIRYKDIYQSFKPVVDFSWDLLQGKSIGNNIQDKDTTKGYRFFIDMAEVWELYLKSLLKRKLAAKGWSIRNDKPITYSGKYHQKQLIPDIVMQRNNDVLVWDAKYKQMLFRKIDFDRTDFFQIHTYINYYQQSKNVIAGGLLYPISSSISETFASKSKSNSLFDGNGSDTKFIVDGIDLSFINNSVKDEVQDDFKEKESQFLERINAVIE